MVDILVVGGGIAGLSVAGRLSKSAKVTLLEAEENLGYHSSSRSAAAFIEDYGNDVIREFNSASKSFLSKDGVDVLSPRGSLILGKKDIIIKITIPTSRQRDYQTLQFCLE